VASDSEGLRAGALGRGYVKYLAVSALVVAALVLLYGFPGQETLQRAERLFAGSGPLGPIYYAVLYIIGSVLMQPCFPLTLGAGFIYGFPKGFAIALLASTLGAVSAFLVARYLARGWLQAKADADERYKTIDRAVTRDGWRVVLLLRLASVLPYNLVNYTIGLTGISLWHFILATWLGRIPITALHTYIGSISPNMTSFSAASKAVSPAELAIYALGWIATVLSMVYITRLARKALDEKSSVDTIAKQDAH